MRKLQENSALVFVLKAMLPYSRQNVLLSHKPHRFFSELAKLSGANQQTLRNAYSRAKRSGLITNDAIPRLTTKGRQAIQPFVTQKLGNNARLLVIFDIPEQYSPTRRHFRRLLRNLSFEQVQRSVWVTDYDHRAVITEAVTELDLDDCVQLFEAARIFPV